MASGVTVAVVGVTGAVGQMTLTRGKPAVTVESGYLGGTDEESIARIERGVIGVMRHLKMMEGEPDVAVQMPTGVPVLPGDNIRIPERFF